MTFNFDKIRERLKLLFDKAECNYEFGGGENEDGSLDKGYVDFEDLLDSTIRVLKEEMTWYIVK
ncbi:hypothetical protein KAR91_86290 [Candidatus Pacearchaeota archaeon]|nr:hypothetical protein [Candidatus Pacearchaeota archaeon]